MSEYIVDFYNRLKEIGSASKKGSSFLKSAVDQIDATLWLIAGYRYSQALVLLHNVIELSLKEIMYEKGGNRGFIKFKDLLLIVSEGNETVKCWQNEIRKAQRQRNTIVHSGGREEDTHNYVQIISTICFPLIDELFKKNWQITLEAIVSPFVYRELSVAKMVCDALQEKNLNQFGHALKTIRPTIFQRDVCFPEIIDENGWVQYEGDREFEIGRSVKKEFSSECSGDILEVCCKICGSHDAFVEVHFDEDSPKGCYPKSMICSKCGLDIKSTDIFLAEKHFGFLSIEEIEQLSRQNYYP